MPSVMQKLKCAVAEYPPKRALANVSNEADGLIGATSISALPRSRQ